MEVPNSRSCIQLVRILVPIRYQLGSSPVQGGRSRRQITGRLRRIHGVDPQAYFLDVLDKLIPFDHRPPEDLVEALLPENWIQANPDKVIKEPVRA